MDLQWRENIVQYSKDNKELSSPYPELDKFMTERSNRNLNFGEGLMPTK